MTCIVGAAKCSEVCHLHIIPVSLFLSTCGLHTSDLSTWSSCRYTSFLLWQSVSAGCANGMFDCLAFQGILTHSMHIFWNWLHHFTLTTFIGV